MKKKLQILLLLVILTFVAAKTISEEIEKRYQEKPLQEEIIGEEKEEFVEVAEVIDGDTIRLKNGRFLRYIGIDTPEKEECFYEEAKAENEKLVGGKEIKIVKDISENDQYGRLLRYVYLEDLSVSEHLVREGFARAANFPPDEKLKDKLKTAEEEARENKRGMWGEGGCE